VGVACAGDDSSRRDSTIRDSAGVTIVESARASWEADGQWTISAEPQLDIGVAEGAAEYQLYRASSAVRLSDGRVVVANGGTNELRFYDRDGSHLMSVGRTGEGPGEFRDLQRVWLLPGDSLLAYDFFPSRLSVFTSSGEFVRSQHFASSDGRQILIRGPLSDGSLIAAGAPIWNAPGATSGVVRDSVPYYRYDATGALIGTLGRFPSLEAYRIVTSDDWRLTSVPFPRIPVTAITGSRFHFGPADTYELRTYTPSGELERVVRLAQPTRAVEPADIDEYKRERLERAERDGERPAMERILGEVPFPQTLPSYDQMVADADGNLWVADYRTVRQDAASWNVFSAAGELMGSVATPARFEVLQIGTDFILGQWLDDLEVEHIRLFALNKP
jgi:hypothetical protein